MKNPLEHFELHPLVSLTLFGIDISINQAVLMMWLVVVVVFAFFWLAGRKAQIIPTKLQGLAEFSIEFLKELIQENAGEKGLRYFPFVGALFFFILFSNLLGLVPGAYTSTSQIMVTGTLAVIVYLASVAIGFAHHGMGYLKVFVPAGVPLLLVPFIVPIEVISQLARPFSLAIRLFANMTAGHVVIAIFLGFVLMTKIYIGWIPLAFTVVFYALEIFISFIQAYIFTLLATVYIGEAIHGH